MIVLGERTEVKIVEMDQNEEGGEGEGGREREG